MEGGFEEKISSESNSGHDEDAVTADYDNNARGNQVHGDVHHFIGDSSGFRIKKVPHVIKNFTFITILLLFYMEVIQLLVEEDQ